MGCVWSVVVLFFVCLCVAMCWFCVWCQDCSVASCLVFRCNMFMGRGQSSTFTIAANLSSVWITQVGGGVIMESREGLRKIEGCHGNQGGFEEDGYHGDQVQVLLVTYTSHNTYNRQ